MINLCGVNAVVEVFPLLSLQFPQFSMQMCSPREGP